MKLEKEGLVVTPLTEQKTGLWDMAFIWFCANVAVPRLMIGGSLAELGFGKMILILIAGNILVFLPLLALGVIGFNVRIPTMAATRMTFGVKGSYLPSVANGIQLLGWGANVTVICGASINSIIKAMTGFENLALWIVVTGIVQLVITAYGVRSITWLQRVSVPLLAILTVVSAILIIKNYGWSSITNYQPVAAIGLLAGLFGQPAGQLLLVEQGRAFGLFRIDFDVFLATGRVADVPEDIGAFHPVGYDVTVQHVFRAVFLTEAIRAVIVFHRALRIGGHTQQSSQTEGDEDVFQ